MLEILLEPADFRTGLVIATLSVVIGVVQFRPADPSGFQPRLPLPLLGQNRLQRRLLLAQRLLARLEVGPQVAPAQGQQFRLEATLLGAVFAILPGGPRLPLQMLKLTAQLVAHVVQPFQILAGVTDAGFGLAATFLVPGNTGGLFEKNPQFLGPGLDHP